MSTWNEWDPLEEVIIGSATAARIPHLDISLAAINYADRIDDLNSIPIGPYPEKVIDEANEDLESFCETLTRLNIKVHRPNVRDTALDVSNGHWKTNGYNFYCPRDSVLVHGPKAVATPMPLRSRTDEHLAFENIFKSETVNGLTWASAPKPKLLDENYDVENISKENLTLKEVEPCFDAANVLRCGKDLFYLVSNSGNKSGAMWLQNFLGEDFKVHCLENIYSYMHLDSTMSFLRPGLVLLNPSRINEENLPPILDSWEKIWCADPVDIGYYGEYLHASIWIGMNLLMVNPNLAIVEESQMPLIKQLEKHKVEVIPLPARHSRTLGGGFHCTSLDIKRQGQLENYF